jgi:hypothetical protein
VNTYHYQVYVTLAGGTEMLLAVLEDVDALAELVRVLCSVDQPQYPSLRVQLAPPH